ncbi:NYN domain-containing protein [Phytoactinopolyspora alkaliphila]|uniref:NYN domain-containing protein n=1 Tax=Phytoactinopolyspora alkaliphila TaxID=1783498 RepID=A0A6N9YTX6_9ACTN|nr:NYN domain-containing protein [Phytoactinopolyspora alkaliphila]
MSQLIVYVDGFNLYHGLHEKWGRRYLWLDLVELARSLRPDDDLVAVKYFTASVLDDPDGQARQDTYINALTARHPQVFSVIYGRYQRKQMTCRTCGITWRSYEEKETDVNISVSIVADAASEAMTSALLVSADSDLAPAIRTAKSTAPGLFAVAAFPPRRSSTTLRTLMPSSFTIGAGRIRAAQLPDIVTVEGATYKRPAKWT